MIITGRARPHGIHQSEERKTILGVTRHANIIVIPLASHPLIWKSLWILTN